MKENDAWVNANNDAFPVNQAAVQALADNLTGLTATRKLEDISDLSAYGLGEPAFTVTAAWTDGTSTTFAMGDSTPFADGYYLTTGQDGNGATVIFSAHDVDSYIAAMESRTLLVPAADVDKLIRAIKAR